MSLSLGHSVGSHARRAAAVLVMLGAVFASGGAWAVDYTWTGAAAGDGQNWYNPTNWGKTAVGDYPKNTNYSAIFPANTDVTVVITNDLTIYKVQFNVGCSVTIKAGEGGKVCPMLKANNALTDNGVVKFKLDGVYFYRDTGWTPKAGSSFELTNGAKLYLSDFSLTTMDSVSLSGGSWMSVNTFSMNGAVRTLTIDDSTFNVRGNGYFGTANPGGGKVVFKGSHPLLRVAGAFRLNNNNAGMTAKMRFDFEVPVGGFAEVPVQSYGEKMMNNQGKVSTGYMQWTVLGTSPALGQSSTLDFCAYMNPRGMYRDKASNGDATTATLRYANAAPDVAATSDDNATLLYLTLGSGEPAEPASHSGGILDYKTTSIARNVITAKGWITAVATDGSTSKLELWAGEANKAATMTLADSVQLGQIGATELSFTAPENIGEKTYYFQFRLYDVNGSVTNYTASSGTFSAATKDTTVYTWKAKDGDWTGDWNDPDHWSTTVTTADGYPHTQNATAAFPVGHKISVTVADNTTVGTVSFPGFDTTDLTAIPDVTFKGGAEGTNKTLTVKSFPVSQPNGRIVFDNLKVSLPAFTLGMGRTIRLQNAAYVSVSDTISHTCGGTFDVAGRSTFAIASMRMYNAASKIVLDDATLRVSGSISHAQQNVSTTGGTIIFKGKNPHLYFASKDNCWNSLDSNNSSCRTVYSFVIPEGGYTATPIDCISTATKQFAYANTRNFQNLYFEVDDVSPCYLRAGNFTQRLVSWSSTGVLTNCLRYVALPDGGTFSYDSDTAPKAIDVNIVSLAHDDKLTVRGADGETFAGVTPAFGVSKLSEVAEGGKIVFTAPTTTAGGVEYVATGYALDEIVKTASGSVTNRIAAGSGSTYEYTVGSAEVLFTWTFAKTNTLTATALNDAGANVAVSTVGGTSTLTASTTTDGMEFQYWYGDLAYADRYKNPISVDRTKTRSVYAFFGRTAANGGVCESKTDKNAVTKQWFDTATWTGGVIPGTNDTASVVWTANNSTGNNKYKVNVPSFFAVKNLVISNALVRINSTFAQGSSTPTGFGGLTRADAADLNRYEPIGCDISGDLVIDVYSRNSSYCGNYNNGILIVGGSRQQCPSQVTVGGDFTVENGSVEIYAGYRFDNLAIDTSKNGDGPSQYTQFTDARAFFRGRNFLRVGGKTTLMTPVRSTLRNVLHVVNDFRTGVAVWLDLQDVTVGANAAFSCYDGGYHAFNLDGTRTSGGYSFCPGGKQTGDNKAGGSHGGFGGSETKNPSSQTATTHDTVYDYEYAPIYPGNKSVANDGYGAGTIRMDCKELALDGRLFATGSSIGKGGTAGGAIWVVCEKFSPGADCLVIADGGTMDTDSAGGGGGRISICEGLTNEQVEQLFAEHTADGISVSSLADKLTTRCSVEGGKKVGTNRSNGYPGTAVYIVNAQGKKTLVVAGDPENFGTSTPDYGTAVFDDGTAITFVAPASAFITDDHRAIRAAEGYVLRDANGEVIKEGTESSFSWKITEDATLTWLLTSVKRKLELSATAGGSIVTNQIGEAGSEWQDGDSQVSLTAVPADGYAFAGWVGEIDGTKQYGTVLTFGMDAARNVKAVFVSGAASETAEWTGAGDGADWMDGANWSTGKAPGPGSAVVIDNKAKVTLSESLVFGLKSLSVAADSTLTFNGMGGFSTLNNNPKTEPQYIRIYDYLDLGFRVAGDVLVAGTVKINRDGALGDASLVAGGEIVVASNAALTVYGGWNPALKANVLDHWDECGVDVQAAKLTVNGTLKLMNEPLSGSPARIRAGSMKVASGAKVSADVGGWFWRSYENGGNESPGPGTAFGNNWGGAAYGGFGGRYNNPTDWFRAAYGEALRPYMPGSAGGNHSGGNRGGGALRIEVEGTLSNAGTISANGAAGGGCNGGGSGGGLWIVCRRLRTRSAAAKLTADGGANASKGEGGGGGGGRLLVCESVSADDVASLWNTGALPAGSKLEAVAVTDDNMSVFTIGTATAKGGKSPMESKYFSGTDGSVYWIRGSQPGMVLIVR